MKNSIATKTAYYGVLIALALIFSYVEVLIPIPIGVPGIKLGLANIVILIGLYVMGTKDAFIISCIRIVLVGFTFGNMFSILYSLTGAILSWLVMVLCKKMKGLSIVGVSIAGGISHNIGQIVVAALTMKTPGILSYLPVLLIAGTITGFVIGILVDIILKVQTKAFK
ncbi:Gx transporter family protein [Anaerocolumna aminovalerica]|jgi:heptaprenyl diphosphate synthase|uniref:Gx transporter family protein n=1 Tax=Anaerocolumna aminovalerica TaxID=1527 RepID=UPI000BE45B46|nr:Gx transporter family protein [Anaerocolumna aminovalerica]